MLSNCIVWKRSRDGALPVHWPLLWCIIPALFAYFLACHPYIYNVFFYFLVWNIACVHRKTHHLTWTFCYRQIFELNQYISSIRTVWDLYEQVCIRQVGIAGLRDTYAELIETCRTDTDPVCSLYSDPLSRCSVVFWHTIPVVISSFSLHRVWVSVHCLFTVWVCSDS